MAVATSSAAASLPTTPAAPLARALAVSVVVDALDEHDDPHTRMGGADPAGGLEPVESRHRRVHHDDVGAPPADQFKGLVAVGRLTDDHHVAMVGQDATQSLADDGVIVDQQHAGAPPCRLGAAVVSGRQRLRRVDHAASEVTWEPRGVGDPGFEPGTSSLSEMRSNRLS